MNCPHCASATTKEQPRKTTLGYHMFRCSACKRFFNERTGTPFNFLEYPTDVVLLVVLWRLRYKLSLWDLAEMFLERGLVFTHETVRDWEARFAPLIKDQLRIKRQGQASRSWYVDETYIKVHGKWEGKQLGAQKSDLRIQIFFRQVAFDKGRDQAFLFRFQFQTPARPPQLRGKAPGRTKGYHPKPRTRFPVIRKTSKRPKKSKTTASA